jgi:cytochrome c oxidase assembly protein subunit 15
MLSSPIIRDRCAILIWLMLCIQLVASMVLVGGYTRLSGSGLSITQWKPIHGVFPPNGDIEWQEEFSFYKNTPQYKLINNDISLDGFKTIFWPEFIHRLLGRIVGLVFAIPLFVFLIRRSISKEFFWRMAGILALGGLQGGIGWIMVKSGLQDAPYVSHTKLALHLSLAFIIFALILWTILDIVNSGKPAKKYSSESIKNSAKYHLTFYKTWFSLLCVQIVFGGFMAGLHAGLIYNTWPTMNGEFFPSDAFTSSSPANDSSSLAINMLRNIAFIQFIHRTLAALLVAIFAVWWYSYREYIRINRLTNACVLVASIIFIQFTLGVLTLIYNVPLDIALAHHFTALLLWTAAILLLYKSIKMAKQNKQS